MIVVFLQAKQCQPWVSSIESPRVARAGDPEPAPKYCTILYYTILYCTILHCTVLYYAVLYYTILY